MKIIDICKKVKHKIIIWFIVYQKYKYYDDIITKRKIIKFLRLQKLLAYLHKK